jgi:hypothetical protein
MYRSVRGHGSNLLECEIHIASHRAVKLKHALAT